MTEKLTYFDFMMYLLPGAFCLLEMLIFTEIVAPDTFSKADLLGESGLLSSIIFVVASFIGGNLVQIAAHAALEPLAKRLFWAGFWPSQLALFPKGPSLSEDERTKLIPVLISIGAGIAPDATPASKPLISRRWGRYVVIRAETGDGPAPVSMDETRRQTQGAQSAFEITRTYLADRSQGVRANTTDAYYQFYRGLLGAATLGALAFGALCVYFACDPSARGLQDSNIRLTLSLAIGLLMCVTMLLWRIRGTAERLVRETYLSLMVSQSSSLKTPETNSSSPSA